MKLPWQRKQTDDSGFPQEVQDYYQAEKRQRVGVASLLAVGTLILTVALATAIFFGGRWIWRNGFHHKPANQPTATVQTADDQTSSSTSKPSRPSTGGSSTTPNPSSGSQSSASQNTNPAPSTVATGNAPMPNTGPSNILPVILGTIALSVFVAEGYQRRALKR